MKKVSKIMANAVKALLLLLVTNMAFSCANTNANKESSTATEAPQETAAEMLDAKYREIEPGSYCWQVNKEVNLHAQPSTGSQVEGPHFQGELLEVLGTQIVDDQLWVNVTYKLKVKPGYEAQFADGQVMSVGSPTGWIGGAVVPDINCK